MMSAAQRQGLDALYVGQLGTGPFATIAQTILENEGIDIALSPRGDLDLGVCIVLVDGAGERTFVTSSGAELTLRPEDLAAIELHPGDVVYVSGYNVVYPQVAFTVSAWLRTLAPDITVAFDPGPRCADIDRDVIDIVLNRTDWLLCNAAEGRLLSAQEDAGDCARALRERYESRTVVVRDGAAGCASASEEGVLRAPGFKASVVDTNGAGDVHNGVIIAELTRGTELSEALLRANAAAAIAIESFGPATCPTRVAVEELLRDQPREVTRI
jgi:sugar/nucleoside kinase (ribokinase family)